MTETTVKARIIAINAQPMSTVWSFTAKAEDGTTVSFHADWRQGRDMCEGLAAQARDEATTLGIDIPEHLHPSTLVCAMDVELIPDDTMGMMMPNVNPLGLNVEHLNAKIAKFNEWGR